MRFDQRWTGWDLLIAVLIALIVVGDMMLAVKIVEVSVKDAEVQAVMEEAQERIDAYYASLPARERPGESGEWRVKSGE